MGRRVSAAGRLFSFDLVNHFVTEVMISRVQTALGNGGLRLEGGRRKDRGHRETRKRLRVACDVPFPR